MVVSSEYDLNRVESDNLEDKLGVEEGDFGLGDIDHSVGLSHNALGGDSLTLLVGLGLFLTKLESTLSFSRIRFRKPTLEVESLMCSMRT